MKTYVEFDGCKIHNYTRHTVDIFTDGKIIKIYPNYPSPRVDEKEETIKTIGPIPIKIKKHTKIRNLPPKEPGNYYVVSSIVALKAKRPDLLMPRKLKRQGKVYGCVGFDVAVLERSPNENTTSTSQKGSCTICQ